MISRLLRWLRRDDHEHEGGWCHDHRPPPDPTLAIRKQLADDLRRSAADIRRRLAESPFEFDPVSFEPRRRALPFEAEFELMWIEAATKNDPPPSSIALSELIVYLRKVEAALLRTLLSSEPPRFGRRGGAS